VVLLLLLSRCGAGDRGSGLGYEFRRDGFRRDDLQVGPEVPARRFLRFRCSWIKKLGSRCRQETRTLGTYGGMYYYLSVHLFVLFIRKYPSNICSFVMNKNKVHRNKKTPHRSALLGKFSCLRFDPYR
jgi:hypothetical protein